MRTQIGYFRIARLYSTDFKMRLTKRFGWIWFCGSAERLVLAACRCRHWCLSARLNVPLFIKEERPLFPSSFAISFPFLLVDRLTHCRPPQHYAFHSYNFFRVDSLSFLPLSLLLFVHISARLLAFFLSSIRLPKFNSHFALPMCALVLYRWFYHRT